MHQDVSRPVASGGGGGGYFSDTQSLESGRDFGWAASAGYDRSQQIPCPKTSLFGGASETHGLPPGSVADRALGVLGGYKRRRQDNGPSPDHVLFPPGDFAQDVSNSVPSRDCRGI